MTVLGRHHRKLEVARTLGFAANLADDVADQARFDVVVDATGRPEGLRRALELVRPRGTIVVKLTFHGEAALASWPIVVNEITLVGSRCGPFAPALELLASGAVAVEPLVSRLATLDDFEAAFSEAQRSLKVIFDLRQANRLTRVRLDWRIRRMHFYLSGRNRRLAGLLGALLVCATASLVIGRRPRRSRCGWFPPRGRRSQTWPDSRGSRWTWWKRRSDELASRRRRRSSMPRSSRRRC